VIKEKVFQLKGLFFYFLVCGATWAIYIYERVFNTFSLNTILDMVFFMAGGYATGLFFDKQCIF